MKVINSINEFPAELKGQEYAVCVALGNFDGVHKGHRALFSRMMEIESDKKKVTVAFTFKPHPLQVLTGSAPALLTPEADKECLIADLGVDYLLNFPFDKEAAAQSPVDFINEVLIKGLNAAEVIVGFNFSFGHKGSGNPELLREVCGKHGVNVNVIEAVKTECGPVSSSLIREYLSKGKVSEANRLLGYEFSLSGVVEPGQKFGRTIGFPTANIAVPKVFQLPAYGVYAAKVLLEGEWHKAVINIGVRPTVSDNGLATVEAHILDFSGDIYGKDIRVYLIREIRPEKKFANADELKAEIQRNIVTAREILA